MAALPEQPSDQHFPDPLEFLNQDFIHPDNQAIKDDEQRRWRLLGFVERQRMQWYVASLVRELRRLHFYENVRELFVLKKRFQKLKASYKTNVFPNDQAKLEAIAQLRKLLEQGNFLRAQINDSRPTFEQWEHYQGWLVYEREHRRELKAEEKHERRVRKDMRRESRLLEHIVYDVWRHTDGCHHIYKAKDKSGKETNKIPKFERTVIKPDAHWFYLRTVTPIPLIGHKYRLPDGVTPDRLQEDEVINALRASLKRQCKWFWTDQNQLVLQVARLDSPDALPRLIEWRNAMPFYPSEKGDRFPYTIGAGDNRRFKWLDFASDPNVLVAGTAGSGKSNLVNGIIATLVSTHSPEELRIVMFDLKGGMEATHWRELPHLLWELVKSVEEVQPVLAKLVVIMRQRMAMLEAVKAKDLISYNARVDDDQRLERLVIAIDEMNNFVGLGSRTEEIHNLIMLLASQGRAVGVHLICCTQHPEVKVIPGRIKTNMSVRACGWMPTISASQIVLDNPEAARLPKLPGRFVVARGMDVLLIQCPHMPDEDIAGVVSSAKLAYPDVKNEIRDLEDRKKPTVWDEQRVIRAALEWTQGQLSAKRLHEMLGVESPGERSLSKLVRGVIDQFEAGTLLHEGQTPDIKRRGKAYIISIPDAHNDAGDAEVITPASADSSPSPSPSTEIAAD